jgi:hypothetical protein
MSCEAGFACLGRNCLLNTGVCKTPRQITIVLPLLLCYAALLVLSGTVNESTSLLLKASNMKYDIGRGRETTWQELSNLYINSSINLF